MFVTNNIDTRSLSLLYLDQIQLSGGALYIRVSHNNTFLRNDLAGLGIIDHDGNIHCDFFLEFLETIFIAAWGHSDIQ